VLKHFDLGRGCYADERSLDESSLRFGQLLGYRANPVQKVVPTRMIEPCAVHGQNDVRTRLRILRSAFGDAREGRTHGSPLCHL